jgi:hypothetical protein
MKPHKAAEHRWPLSLVRLVADNGAMLIGRLSFRRLFGVQSGIRARLHVCAKCEGEFVHATRWDDPVDGTRRVGLRCAACGHERETVADLTATALFQAAHTDRVAQLAEAADELARQQMASWVDSFAGALERDLIEAADFK